MPSRKWIEVNGDYHCAGTPKDVPVLQSLGALREYLDVEEERGWTFRTAHISWTWLCAVDPDHTSTYPIAWTEAGI